MDNVAQGSHRELGLPVIERTRYCQQHRDSVKKKTFDQSEHDTRIWYHGTAASKAWHHGSTQLLLSTYKVSQRNFFFFFHKLSAAFPITGFCVCPLKDIDRILW